MKYVRLLHSEQQATPITEDTQLAEPHRNSCITSHFHEFSSDDLWQIANAPSVAEDRIRYVCHIALRGEHPQ